MSGRFGENEITDQKRLVRGEQLLAARAYLRARDHSHNRVWRVMTLAGGAPAGEVAAIKELMPKAQIIAVDRSEECLLAAIEAGVHDAIKCDLSGDARLEPPRIPCGTWCSPRHPGGYHNGTPRWVMAKAIADLFPFDILNLDFCCTASPELKRLISLYSPKASRGVVIATFSYGRDVTEAFEEYRNKHAEDAGRLRAAGIPDHVAARLLYLFPSAQQRRRLRSVMLYKGHEMPMASVLLHPGYRPLSFVRVAPGDFELAVTCPDPSKMYACPQERIESLRRSHAAIRASYTRSERRTG